MNITSINQLIDNSIDIDPKEDFAAIIGQIPSKGARSPLLWNAVFEEIGIHTKMIPLDVSAQNIHLLIDVLSKDHRFIGGAIAVPYKEYVAKHPQLKLTNEAASIGAVNALYRDKDSLVGTNTDGEAAVSAFEGAFGSLKGKRVLIFGLGGAGKAVSIYVKKAVGPQGVTYVTNRSVDAQQFALANSLVWIDFGSTNEILSRIDVVVNCTILGSNTLFDQSPISAKQMDMLHKNVIVYDVIYDPNKTKLLDLAQAAGLRILNGIGMNLDQAVLAFEKATHQLFSQRTIKKIMLKKIEGSVK
jgi:shikimate dehydrogenase